MAVLDMRDSAEMTPLHCAAKFDHSSLVEFLHMKVSYGNAITGAVHASNSDDRRIAKAGHWVGILYIPHDRYVRRHSLYALTRVESCALLANREIRF